MRALTDIFFPDRVLCAPFHIASRGAMHSRDLSTGLDKGAAQLIADGKILVKSGVSPTSFTEQTMVLSDGTELHADAVIFA